MHFLINRLCYAKKIKVDVVQVSKKIEEWSPNFLGLFFKASVDAS